MFSVTDEEFEAMVDKAIASIPAEIAEEMENVVVMVADEPDDEQLATSGDDNAVFVGDDVLGLYDGVSIDERADGYGFLDAPDVITLFKGPHERCFDSREEIEEEVRKTLVHEIGHYFGHGDEALYEMGY